LIRAARYLGVAPWDLAERPICWQDWAIAFEEDDIWAEGELMRRSVKS